MSEELYLVEACCPAPWWDNLFYLSRAPLAAGVRVDLPLGRSRRRGWVVSCRPLDGEHPRGVPDLSALRDDLCPVDLYPFLTDGLWALSDEIGKLFLTSRGLVLAQMCPPRLEPIREPLPARSEGGEGKLFLFYSFKEWERWGFYCAEAEGAAERGEDAVLVFPEVSSAERFFSFARERLKGLELHLWRGFSSRRALSLWLELRLSRGGKVVVGARSSVFVPSPRLGLMVVEQEASPYLISQRHGTINARTVAYMRSKVEGFKLVLGGDMPSSRSYRALRSGASGELLWRERVPFRSRDGVSLHVVDLRRARDLGPVGGTRISPALVSATRKVLDSGGIALWLLDRKGYSALAVCEDCGTTMSCPRCSRPLSLSRSGGQRCRWCGISGDPSERCPRCGSPFRRYLSPGLEAYAEVAGRLFGEGKTAVLRGDLSRRALAEVLGWARGGGLILGSRGSLDVLESARVSLCAWLDLELELSRPDYDVVPRLYGAILQSGYRGLRPGEEREVYVQTRNPRSWFVNALKGGPQNMWSVELEGRRIFGYPPFVNLYRLRLALRGGGEGFASSLPSFAELIGVSEEGEDLEVCLRSSDHEGVRGWMAGFFALRRPGGRSLAVRSIEVLRD